MTTATYQALDLGLRIVQGAWSQLSPAITRIAETDEELDAAWTAIDKGLCQLDTLIRDRMRAERKAKG